MRRFRRMDGFSLIELLVVLAIIGLLASVLIPNLLDALQKARQKRTLMDVRGIGTAWLSWVTDLHGASSAGAAKLYDRSTLGSVSYVSLLRYLRPTDTFFYAQDLPQFDSWRNSIRFEFNGFASRVDSVLVCSGGRDGIFSDCAQPQITTAPFISTDYDRDIVWADGYFLRWPAGTASSNN